MQAHYSLASAKRSSMSQHVIAKVLFDEAVCSQEMQKAKHPRKDKHKVKRNLNVPCHN